MTIRVQTTWTPAGFFCATEVWNVAMSTPVGECFTWAWKKLLEIDHVEARLVHARVTFPWPPGGGVRFLHAWIEDGPKVYDWQNVVVRKQPAQSVEAFYEIWKPEHVDGYSVRQALEMYRRHHHTGPWTRWSR